MDKIKSILLTFIIGGPFISLLLVIIQWGGTYFYFYVWIFMFLFSIIMMTLVPIFIMPLFNKYEPLSDGLLKERIFELAKQLSYPLTKLFVMDGSKRSSHSNAFMFGFGNNKRIVLFDTLMTQVDPGKNLKKKWYSKEEKRKPKKLYDSFGKRILLLLLLFFFSLKKRIKLT